MPLLWGDRQEFVLPRLAEASVVYDAHWERQGLGGCLHVPDSELCVDLYGTKANRSGRRLWLTMERSPHKLLASFGLSMRPHEVNVRLGIPGNDIFLYDTAVAGDERRGQGRCRTSVTKTLYDIRSVAGGDLFRVTLHHCRAAIRKRMRRMTGP